VTLLIAGLVFIPLAVNEQFEIRQQINPKLPPDAKFETIFSSYGARDDCVGYPANVYLTVPARDGSANSK